MSSPINPFYQEKVQLTQNKIAALHREINRLSFARLALILVGGAAVFKIVQSEHVWLTLLSFFFVLLAFVWLVARQSKRTKAKKNAEDDLMVLENEINCLAGKPSIYHDGSDFVDDRHVYTSDLDVFGTNSIYHKINRATTVGGRNVLANWLSAPATRQQILDRQLTAQELEQDPSWCLDFLARLIFSLKEKTDFKDVLIGYLTKPYTDFGKNWLRFYTKIAPYMLGIAAILSILYGSWYTHITLFLFIFNILLTMAYAGKVTLVATGMGRMGNLLERFGDVFERIETKKWQTNLMKNSLLAKDEGEGHAPVSQSIRKLGSLINKLDYRLNIFVASFLNGVLLWDFKQVFAILDWRKNHHYQMAQLFDELANVEALISFAFIRINDPSWTYPRILATDNHVLQMGRVKHPLIYKANAVPNDYRLEEYHLALITGSNMAGKSTFLRTIGINIVLALGGAPVCAEYFELSVMQIVTYMRIRDSLNESTSTFKAELDRLDMILKLVAKQPNAFFLVDEMLRGTNSVDKYLGSKAVIEKLISDKGVGMVATHDLQLAKLEETYPDYLANYHFDIQVIDGEMVFDYKLKKGACKIFNASMLLKRIGIDISF
ncbi:MutS family DNA mismatch repair protein [Olivibacter ginsenosidimutans]|uniref:MutS family DNA mismatch repair protein n=1 Tax=Olivibacter ginsenosidimutans TaxID=1176537 RepID=A0ABP9BRT9_9SPHI